MPGAICSACASSAALWLTARVKTLFTTARTSTWKVVGPPAGAVRLAVSTARPSCALTWMRVAFAPTPSKTDTSTSPAVGVKVSVADWPGLSVMRKTRTSLRFSSMRWSGPGTKLITSKPGVREMLPAPSFTQTKR